MKVDKITIDAKNGKVYFDDEPLENLPLISFSTYGDALDNEKEIELRFAVPHVEVIEKKLLSLP